jgi:fluoroacetyl-CoA thioesterase
MKPTLVPGIAYELRFAVTEAKTVPSLYPEGPEFQQMPSVFATGCLVGLLEWCCVKAINEHLNWPNAQTLGTHVDVSHSAATPPGLEVVARARLVRVEGRRLVFEVEPHDGIDVISRGTHERFVIERQRFAGKMNAKVSSAPGQVNGPA